MAISPARHVAFSVLMRVQEQDAYASDLLQSQLTSLSPEDRGLAHEIVMGVLRWRSRLDAEIALHSFTPIRKLDAAVLTSLRMAVFQLRYLERVPGHAIVHDAVDQVKAAGKTSAAGLVNAVLRKVGTAKLVPKPETIAERYAHPEWLVERWIAHYGEETVRAICEFDQQPPPTFIRVRRGVDEDEVLKSLVDDGIAFEASPVVLWCYHVTAGDVLRSHAWQHEQIAIQDEGSQLVAQIASAIGGEPRRVLDCCAAPGGKTMMLAEAHPNATVIAVELHEHRATALRKRCSTANVEVVHADIAQYQSTDDFDLVLADVPCSGTGTLARNPEIKWRLQASDVAELAARQTAILKAAIGLAKSGAIVVYSTCSLEPEESEEVFEQAAPEASCEIVSLPELVNPGARALARGPYLRTLPGIQQCDGFFIAALRKR